MSETKSRTSLVKGIYEGPRLFLRTEASRYVSGGGTRREPPVWRRQILRRGKWTPEKVK